MTSTRGSPVQASGKRASLFLTGHHNNGHMATIAPFILFTDPFCLCQPPNISFLLLSSNPHTLQCTSPAFLLRSGSHRSLLDTRSSNLSGATTASTKTFLTALALNGIIAGVEIVAFTVVWRYFRLVYEPRSLSVFESCAEIYLFCNASCLPLYSLVQKETAAIISSPLGMAYICLQNRLS